MKKFALFILTLAILTSCNDKKTSKNIPQDTITKVEQITQESLGTPINYPSIPRALVERLYKDCSYMDYIFFELDFSMSQDNPNSLKGSIAFISTDVPNSIPVGCKSIGRKFFHVEGNIIIEAEIYLSDNCSFYVFYQDEKPIYANKMTQEGVNFYNNIKRQGNQERQKIINK